MSECIMNFIVKTGRFWIAAIALVALATGCIDATTVYVVADPGASPPGDDGGAAGADGPGADGTSDAPTVVGDGASGDAPIE